MSFVIAAQARAHDFISFLLRGDVNGRVHGQAGLRDACRVLVFKILPDVFHRIIESRRECLGRLIVGRIGELNRFRFCGLDI